MKMVRLKEENEIKEFAIRAAIYFEEHKKCWSFTDQEIQADCLFALRFGLGRDCVVVFKLDENFEPINYQEIINN